MLFLPRFPAPWRRLPHHRPLLASKKQTLYALTCLIFTLTVSLSLTPTSRAESRCARPDGDYRAATSLPLRETGYYLTAIAKIHGHPLSMIVDTGSEGSLLTPDAIDQLHLTPDEGEGTIISGPDGRGHIVPTIQLARLRLGDVTFHQPILPLGALPGFPTIQPPVLGLIGMDLLGRYDIELDIPHHRLTLWDSQPDAPSCHKPPFWHEGGTRLAAQRIGDRFFIPFTLDGQAGIALIDSGARSHIISTDFVHKLGISDERLAQDPGGTSAGIGDKEHLYHWHRFGKLTLGGQSQTHPVLTVTPLHEQADMLLGADWLTHHQLWLSAEQEGAVFIRRADESGYGQKKVKK